MKDAFKEGKTIQFCKDWTDIGFPAFDSPVECYRIKPEVDPYKELKEAYASGKTIQCDKSGYGWDDIYNPKFNVPVEYYRIKPEVDPYKELKEAYASGKTIQCDIGWDWDDIYNPKFDAPVEYYRIKPSKGIPYNPRENEKASLVVTHNGPDMFYIIKNRNGLLGSVSREELAKRLIANMEVCGSYRLIWCPMP